MRLVFVTLRRYRRRNIHTYLQFSFEQLPLLLVAQVQVTDASLSTMFDGDHDPSSAILALLNLSRSARACTEMRRGGCIALLVRLLHCNATAASIAPVMPTSSEGRDEGDEADRFCFGSDRAQAVSAARSRVTVTLRNIVRSNPDELSRACEEEVLRILELLRHHCYQLSCHIGETDLVSRWRKALARCAASGPLKSCYNASTRTYPGHCLFSRPLLSSWS